MSARSANRAPGSAEPQDKATPTDRTMMRRALALARLAAREGEAPIGAVVYRAASGEILGEGRNTREREADPCGHAELHAIRAAAAATGDWRLADCTLVVTLEPCPMCAGAIVNSRIGRLIFGATDPKAGAVETLFRLCDDARLNHRVPTIIGGVMARSAASALKSFFRARRKGAAKPPKPKRRAAPPER